MENIEQPDRITRVTRAVIDEVDGWSVRIPLSRPYDLSFTSVTHLESVIIRIRAAGEEGWGESTPLLGYSPETIDDVWSFAQSWAPRLPGSSFQHAEIDLAAANASSFMRVPFVSALESCLMASGELSEIGTPWRDADGLNVPLVGTVQGDSLSEKVACAEALVAEGYETLKVKIAVPPVSPQHDAECCCALRGAVGSKVLIRVDANQGYDLEQALTFVSLVKDLELELLEQPLKIDSWSEMKFLRTEAEGMSLMLDESIQTLEDVKRCAANACADIIKLKLMKVGGLRATLNLAREAQEVGLGVIIGNGVQTDIGCHQESRLHALVDGSRAGEQNGFLKVKQHFLAPSLKVVEGRLRIEKAATDSDRVASQAVDSMHYG